MPWIVPALPAIAAGVGGALSNKSSQTTTPTLDPAYAGLQTNLLNLIQGRLSAPSALPAGYETGGIRNINSTYDLIKQSLGNTLSARGLSTSPIAGVVDTNQELARGGDIARFQSGLPLVERSLRTEDLGLASNLLGLGRGSTTAMSSGGGAAGSMTNLAQILGYLMASGAFGKGGGNLFSGGTQPGGYFG